MDVRRVARLLVRVGFAPVVWRRGRGREARCIVVGVTVAASARLFRDDAAFQGPVLCAVHARAHGSLLAIAVDEEEEECEAKDGRERGNNYNQQVLDHKSSTIIRVEYTLKFIVRDV